MNEHKDKTKCPFKVGQLMRGTPQTTPHAIRKRLYLLLDIEWSPIENDWFAYLLSQQTGEKSPVFSDSLGELVANGTLRLITQQSQEDTEE